MTLSPCVRLTQESVLQYLRMRGGGDTVLSIRFGLDFSHGHVYPRSSVLRVLQALKRKGEVVNQGEMWSINEE